MRRHSLLLAFLLLLASLLLLSCDELDSDSSTETPPNYVENNTGPKNVAFLVLVLNLMNINFQMELSIMTIRHLILNTIEPAPFPVRKSIKILKDVVSHTQLPHPKPT